MSVVRVSSLRRSGSIVVIFTALAAAFTWPLLRHMGDSIPGDLGDPLLNAWILGWDAERLRHGLRGVWDAPIFYPYEGTLAFSEHLFGIAFFVAPIVWVTGNPLIAYNVAFLLSFVLAGTGMFLLVRELTGRDDSAWIAGVIFAFMPARLGHIGHLQVLMSGWMPFALWALHRFMATTSKASLLAFVAFALVQCLSNNYFVYFFSIACLLVAAHGLHHAPPARRPQMLRGLVAAGAALVCALAPIAFVYFDVRRFFGFRRTFRDAIFFGADLAAYLHGNEAVRQPLMLWRHLPFVAKPAGPEGELFVGVLALALATIGVVVSWRRRQEPAFSRARVYAIVLAVALLLSLGFEPTAWRRQLPIGSVYQALFFWWPGFDGLRVPARMSVVVDLAVAVLAGVGVAALVGGRRRAIQWLVTSACLVVVVLEGYAAPVPLAFVGRNGRMDRAAYDWIRDHAPGPVLELPTGELAPILQSYVYEYQTFFHRQPIVNGASGYNSPLHRFLGSGASPLVEFARFAEGLKMVRGLGVRSIIVHPEAYRNRELAAETLAALRSNPQVVQHAAFPGLEIFRLAPFVDQERPERSAGREERAFADQALKEISPAEFVAVTDAWRERLPLAFDRNPDTRWTTGRPQEGNEVIEITFNRPRDVARLRLLTPSLGDYARHLVVQAVDDAGQTQTVFAGPVQLQFGAGLVRDPVRAPIDVWLRPNRARQLRLLQTASVRRWQWSIHELFVWELQGANF